MSKNNSPWIYQLNRKRVVSRVGKKHSTDVAIIGAGIAGIATAYFLLRHTKLRVSLIEGKKVAHGATGHNGGFLASYFERTFSDMASEFGHEMTVRAEQDMESSWEMLDEIREVLQIKTPMWQFTGYAAIASTEDILHRLENNYQRRRYGLVPELILVSNDVKKAIPKKFTKLCRFMDKTELLELLETEDSSYVGALASRKGCMNSAIFCEEVVLKLQKKYSRRFTLAENTLVNNVVLRQDSATLHCAKGQIIDANRVVLCTNGFEKITLTNIAGADINTKFHYLVRGIVGYMAAYTEESDKPAAEISYLPKGQYRREDVYLEEPYYYLTRRPFYDHKKKPQKLNLISIGGPEALLEDTNGYNHEHPYPAESKKAIDNFLRYTYKHGIKDRVKYRFLWHGLMGFTPNGVRLIGPEPLNPVLYYNLGCNGVGLLPSIFGGKKISQQFLGIEQKPSVFDPKLEIKTPVVGSGEIPDTIMNENSPYQAGKPSGEWLATVLIFSGVMILLLALFTYILINRIL